MVTSFDIELIEENVFFLVNIKHYEELYLVLEL